MKTALILAAFCICVINCKDLFHPKLKVKNNAKNSEEQDSQFWIDKAQAELNEQIQRKLNTNVAKNVILFLGDGMSIATLSATRIYQSQITKNGEEEFLSFEKFPHTGLSRTYCVDKQVADSACSATAYLGGVKGNYGTIGVNANVPRGNCEASKNVTNHVDSIAKWAQNAGKASGIVTTTRVSHASPAGVFAHVADRNWENDAALKEDLKASDCDDITKQLVLNDPGKNFQVIMGGGRNNFIPNNESDPVSGKGSREDGNNLINAWIKDKEDNEMSYAYVWNRTALLSVETTPKYILGLFNKDHMDNRLENNTLQPTLEEMTEYAIKVLQQYPNGFFLFVEGGKIDLAHHENQAHMSLDETVEFSKAVQKAVSLTNEDETLIVVTSDHAHTMTLNGYASRSESVFGFGGNADDKHPYSILSYANGPGYAFDEEGRHDPTADDIEKYDYRFPAGVPLGSETHGGDDVAVFANGPWSHIFTGSYEQNYIPHAMAYASCIGNGLTSCD